VSQKRSDKILFILAIASHSKKRKGDRTRSQRRRNG